MEEHPLSKKANSMCFVWAFGFYTPSVFSPFLMPKRLTIWLTIKRFGIKKGINTEEVLCFV
jgi:hypothetical protein